MRCDVVVVALFDGKSKDRRALLLCRSMTTTLLRERWLPSLLCLSQLSDRVSRHHQQLPL